MSSDPSRKTFVARVTGRSNLGQNWWRIRDFIKTWLRFGTATSTTTGLVESIELTELTVQIRTTSDDLHNVIESPWACSSSATFTH